MKLDLNQKGIYSFFTNKFVNLSDHSALPPNHQFSQKRLSDFSTGRYCAQKALEQLEIYDAIIPIGVDRAPIWPEGIVGSISHCSLIAGAVVANKSDYISLGLDIEEIGRVTTDLWDLVFTENEKNHLAAFPKLQIEKLSTAAFSIKEAFYKFQFPLTQTFIDFPDVEIIFGDSFSLRIVNDKYKKLFSDVVFPAQLIYNEHCVISWITAKSG